LSWLCCARLVWKQWLTVPNTPYDKGMMSALHQNTKEIREDKIGKWGSATLYEVKIEPPSSNRQDGAVK
jgi:hypothetical protein